MDPSATWLVGCELGQGHPGMHASDGGRGGVARRPWLLWGDYARAPQACRELEPCSGTGPGAGRCELFAGHPGVHRPPVRPVYDGAGYGCAGYDAPAAQRGAHEGPAMGKKKGKKHAAPEDRPAPDSPPPAQPAATPQPAPAHSAPHQVVSYQSAPYQAPVLDETSTITYRSRPTSEPTLVTRPSPPPPESVTIAPGDPRGPFIEIVPPASDPQDPGLHWQYAPRPDAQQPVSAEPEPRRPESQRDRVPADQLIEHRADAAPSAAAVAAAAAAVAPSISAAADPQADPETRREVSAALREVAESLSKLAESLDPH